MSVAPLPAAEESYGIRSCPSCGSTDADRAVTADVPAEKRSFESVREHWYGFFKEKIFFSYDRCRSCGILYATTFLTAQQLEVLYASMPPNMEEASGSALDRTQRGYFDEVKAAAALRGNFLEIGPDIGAFARHFAEEGSFDTFWMFEPNVDAHAQLRTNLGTSKVNISTALLDLSEVPDRSITIAAMIHVLDHIIDPVEFLQHLRPKMADDGKLFIVTHDERSLLARLTKARWPAYCLQHPHLFNPASMQRLLPRGGFALERTIRSVNYFPVTFLVEHAALAAGFQIKLPRLSGLQMPLRLGNFMTVALPA
jgi:hypothetical protein